MIKIKDPVYYNALKLIGHIERIRNGMVTIVFITGQKVRKNKKDIKNVNNQWRIDD